jgi:glycosyltransferase involved in cell wall biosynthesis
MQSSPKRVVVLMPVRDDWPSAAELTRRLDTAIDPRWWRLDIMLVDDGSIQHCEPAAFAASFSAVQSIRILRLRRNVGHQRAIAIGLVHIHNTWACDAVVVMDADGEDTPEGLVALLDAFSMTNCSKAVFAERIRRSESLAFQLFYQLYRAVHLGLTGISVRVGNFSIMPAHYLEALVVVPELWNHYAAAVFRSRLPRTMFPIPRGKRIAGKSKMNFVALVTHGLSAISVFGDTVGVRLLMASLGGSFLAVMAIVLMTSVRLAARQGIPEWVPSAAGLLAVVMIQFVTIAASFTFFVLSNRMNLSFVPLRDCPLFEAGTTTVYPND